MRGLVKVTSIGRDDSAAGLFTTRDGHLRLGVGIGSGRMQAGRAGL